MLQSMRKVAHSWVVKGLMLFLIVSFSIWGIGDIFRGNPLQKEVAKVGDRAIVVQTLNQAFDRALTRARQTADPNLTAERAKKMGLLDQTLQDQIRSLLIEQEIARLGLDVAPEQILKLVAQEPALRKADGTFDRERFRQILRQQNISEATFVAQGQQEMARQALLIGLTVSPVVPKIMVDALYKAQAQKRILDVVTIDADKIAVPAPKDDALHAYYDKNANDFAAPEYRGVTLATLSVDAIEKDTEVSDAQLKQEFETNGERYAAPERRDVVQVVMQDQARAQQLAAQARASGDLVVTAKANKETAIPLEKLEERALMPELAKPIFAMESGAISEPIRTSLGWHVVQLKKITPAGKPDFDKIKDKLRETMRRDMAIEAATRTVNKMDDELAAGHSLEDIADTLRLRLVKIPSLDAKGLTPEGKPPVELPMKDLALKLAFGQNAGEVSPIEDDKQGHYLVVRTDEVTPAAPKPFDTVKDEVVKAWTAHEQFAAATTLAEKTSAALGEGKPAASLAAAPAVSARLSAPISQLGDKDAALPADVTTAALSLGKGEVRTAMDNGKLYVVRVAKIEEPEANPDDPRRTQIVDQVKKTAAAAVLAQYLDHLETVFPVKINAPLLAKLRGQQEQP